MNGLPLAALRPIEAEARHLRGSDARLAERAMRSARWALMKTPHELHGHVVKRLEAARRREAERTGEEWKGWKALEAHAEQFSTFRGPAGLPMAAGEDAMREAAERISKEVMHLVTLGLKLVAPETLEQRYEAMAHVYDTAAYRTRQEGIEPPELPARATGRTLERAQAAAVRRMMCPRWWLRHIRQEHGRWLENVARKNGFIGRHVGSPYVSDATLRAYRDMRRRNRSILAELDAVCEELDLRIPLLDAVDASTANPKNRQAEMMLRVRGLEEWATARGWVGSFWTLTTPSRYHRWSQDKKDKTKFWPNRKWDGSTPRDGQLWLRNVWARIRAKLARAGVTLCGLRVAEPHHDGCPHWHVLVFGPAETLREAAAIARRYMLQDCPDEPGASERRFKVEDIDPERGSAAGYVAKYIAKHVDADATGLEGEADYESGLRYEVNEDEYKRGERPEALDRVLAWASLWGIRQFQFFRAGPVTVWRELRRLDAAEAKRNEHVRAAWEAANAEAWGGMGKADWREFLRAMEKHPIQLFSRVVPTEYGDERRRVVGLECGGRIFVTREHEWKIERRRRQAVDAGVSGAWTRDNNYTGEPGTRAAEPPPKSRERG